MLPNESRWPVEEYLVLSVDEAAELFRGHASRPLGGCQADPARWWVGCGLVLGLADGEWRLAHLDLRPVKGVYFDERAWCYVFDYETGETSWWMGCLCPN